MGIPQFVERPFRKKAVVTFEPEIKTTLEVRRQKGELPKSYQIEQKQLQVVEQPKPQNNFERALSRLINDRPGVLREQEDEKVQVLEINEYNTKCILFHKMIFSFDNLGFYRFKEWFNVEPYSLKVERVIYKNGQEAFYLSREHKRTGWNDSLHRWLMKGQIKAFCSRNDYDEKDVVIHHIDFDSQNNEIKNLRVMTKREHDELHGRSVIKNDFV